MAHQDVEIEIQVQVEHVEPLLEFLKREAEYVSEGRQVDDYYAPAHRNFIDERPTNEWLRVRDADGRYSINYKRWHRDADGKSTHCDEYESSVERAEQVKKILSALDFKPLATVDKRRKIWRYRDYEVALDAVEGLGDFVEIEYIGGDSQVDPREVTAGMVAFLKDLGCGKVTRNYSGYPFILLFPDEVKYEEL